MGDLARRLLGPDLPPSNRQLGEGGAAQAFTTRASTKRLLPSEKMAAVFACVVVLVVFLTTIPLPKTGGGVIGPRPDSMDYIDGAQSLLRGQYSIKRDGVWKTPQYTPGFSAMLAPVIKLGGVGWARRLAYVSTLLLALLAALLAARLGGAMAAPLAAAGILSTDAMTRLSTYVMSDVPAATVVMLELVLLTLGRGALAHGAAGVLAGYLVWIRPATLVLVLAGLAGTSARRQWRKCAAWYILGAAPLVMLLAAWQFTVFGSPLKTSYQAANVGPGGGQGAEGRDDLGAFFSPDFALRPLDRRDGPSIGGAAMRWRHSNAVTYPQQLLGVDGFAVLPGVGLLGLAALFGFLRSNGQTAVFARGALAAVLWTFGTYLVHGYQSGRYMLVPGVLLTVAAAVLVSRVLLTAFRRLRAQTSGR